MKETWIVIHEADLHDIARLILILYCIAKIFKTIIDKIFIYSFRYNTKIVVSRIVSKNLVLF